MQLNYNISQNITREQNRAGTVIPLSGSLSTGAARLICAPDTFVIFSYGNVQPPSVDEPTWHYQKVDDYIAVALKITSRFGKVLYASGMPMISGNSTLYLDAETVPQLATFKPFAIGDQIELRVRLLKPIMGTVTIPSTRVMDFKTVGGNLGNAIPYSVFVSGTLTSNQSCQVNLNKTVEFNFHEIRAWDFSDAGVGGRPASAPVQTKSLAIQCNGVDAGASLRLSLAASNTSGNALVSSNKDIGFIVADGNNAPLTPDGTSHIPFTLDSASSATVNLAAWPVSITGHTPVAGEFSAQAFLKLDFQ